MSTENYTHAQNAALLRDLAGKLAHVNAVSQEQIAHLNALAAREAEQDQGYVDYVNSKVRAALEKPGKLHTQAEAEALIESWA